MVEDIEITPLGRDDIPAVIGLWQACGLTRPWNDPHADAIRALDGPGSTILTARRGAALLGSVMVGHDGHRGWVYYLSVQPGIQRKGLGTRLMRAAEAWLTERGVPKLNLMVRNDNSAARGFYERLGYDTSEVVVLARFLDRRA